MSETKQDFETWAKSEAYSLTPAQYASDIYECALTRAAWESWRAATARKWKPIESAPKIKDTAILAVGLAQINNEWLPIAIEWDFNNKQWVYSESLEPLTWEPLLFMLMPRPPNP